jgi:L-lactate transport
MYRHSVILSWSRRTVTWNQTYYLFGHGIGISLLIASLPILTLLILLGVLRKPSWVAGLAGLAVTFAVALGAYHMPPLMAVHAAANGMAFGLLPICWIVFWAIALYRLSVNTGQFEIIKQSIGRLTTDKRLQGLLIAFIFGAFLEGAAGFGTPVAIASAMLIGLGFEAFEAAALCLLANTAPVAFGSIGIPTITLAGTTGLPLDRLSADTALICAPIALLLPFYILIATGGFSSLAGVVIPTLITGVVFAGVEFYVATYIGPQLTDILAAIITIAVLVLYLRLRPARKKERIAEENTADTLTFGRVLYAWLPYTFLVICVLLWSWKPMQALLNRGTIVIRWPYLHDLVLRMPPIAAAPSPYHAIYNLNWFSAAGTACMAATLLSALAMRVKPRDFLRLLADVTRQLRLPIVTVTSVLAIAFLMNYCGATATLGLAFAATGKLFPFFSAMLGWIGVFLTGSDTSSNALFGNLQVVTATRLGLDPVLMAAANSSGGVMGKMISLQTIAIAAAATGLSQQDQSRLFRFTLRHSILLATLAGCLALLYTHTLR